MDLNATDVKNFVNVFRCAGQFRKRAKSEEALL